MSFRRRNVPLARPNTRDPTTNETQNAQASGTIDLNGTISPAKLAPGVRPSPVDGRPTTSTGTASLDDLLAGHAGLALGNSILIEEDGTTDYAGSLLRFYAAEGVLQKHQVHVIGMRENWGRELPGISGAADHRNGVSSDSKGNKDKMKIAWRYESLSGMGIESSSRNPMQAPAGQETIIQSFCHSYDLTKRLELPSPTAISYIPISASPLDNPFHKVIELLTAQLLSSTKDSIHRVVIPNLLSPALYSQAAARPTAVLQFLHALRALLRQYATRMTALISLPLSLFPRSTGLTRWLELLCDGVVELVPFPHTVDAGPALPTSGASSAQEESPQGMVRLHRLPVFHERGGGATGTINIGEELAFTLSRRRFVIKPFTLPPVESIGNQPQETQVGKTKADIEF